MPASSHSVIQGAWRIRAHVNYRGYISPSRGVPLAEDGALWRMSDCLDVLPSSAPKCWRWAFAGWQWLLTKFEDLGIKPAASSYQNLHLAH